VKSLVLVRSERRNSDDLTLAVSTARTDSVLLDHMESQLTTRGLDFLDLVRTGVEVVLASVT
jgi:hypothetical protein